MGRIKVLVLFVVSFIFETVQAGQHDYLAEFVNIINRTQLEKSVGYSIARTEVADECTVFMDHKAFHGPLGQAIAESITENPLSYPYMLHGGSINRYCRKYETMSAKHKASIWVLVMTVMAHFESTCSNKAKAQGPNGIAYGFFQLHKGKEDEYLGDDNAKACAKNASLDPKKQTLCALAMLENQLRMSRGDLFSKSSYWDVLRPNGQSGKAHQISKALTRFSACNPKAL